MRRLGLSGLMLLAMGCGVSPASNPVRVDVGSKAFTEGVLLGEVLTGLAATTGAEPVHHRQLGGTRVVWNALLAGEIGAYVEYTGTLSQEVFEGAVDSRLETLAPELTRRGVILGPELGFTNTYAIGMSRAVAAAAGVATISDLAASPALRLGFSNEFMDRADGWPGLRQAYSLPHTDVSGIEHALAYRAVAEGGVDATDLYSTDAEIALYDLQVLEDDRGFFPDYRAVILYRADLERRAPAVVSAFQTLAGRIDEAEMIRMNLEAKLEGVAESSVAAGFLRRTLGLDLVVEAPSRAARIRVRTLEHLALVAISLLAAIVVALPLGIAAVRFRKLGTFLLGAVAVVQTIPSLALLVFMIPLLGIGAPPAIVALFLYSLLPIVRNTAAGLAAIPTSVLESADALGLPKGARLRLVELPVAAPAILAGIKTAAVINVGTATLGALIGAGGYGQAILTGIRLDDAALILEGAVPAALLALGAQGAFDVVERLLVSRGLRL